LRWRQCVRCSSTIDCGTWHSKDGTRGFVLSDGQDIRFPQLGHGLGAIRTHPRQKNRCDPTRRLLGQTPKEYIHGRAMTSDGRRQSIEPYDATTIDQHMIAGRSNAYPA
jgi:hypothetical protein